MVRATNWVGDAIMALPALRATRKKFPQASISVLARSYVADIYRDQDVCDELIVYDPRGQHKGWRGRERLVGELRTRRFDVALLLQNAFDAAWLAWRAGIPERIGYARDGRGLLLTKSIALPRPGEVPSHEKFYYLELLRRSGWIDALPKIERITLQVSQARKSHAEETLLNAGGRPGALRLAIAAGASYGSAKCWPPDRFVEFVNHFQSERDVDVILFGTSGEVAVSDAIVAGVKRKPVNLTGKTSITEFPALLSQCHLFLGNDSGAMHIAAAVGLPITAVFGPTDPDGTAPVTLLHTIVQQKPYCSPCFLKRCPTDHRCMTAVTPEVVEMAVNYWARRTSRGGL
jgi:heptosyltransferase II